MKEREYKRHLHLSVLYIPSPSSFVFVYSENKLYKQLKKQFSHVVAYELTDILLRKEYVKIGRSHTVSINMIK